MAIGTRLWFQLAKQRRRRTMRDDRHSSEFITFYIGGLACADTGKRPTYTWVEDMIKKGCEAKFDAPSADAAKFHALLGVVERLPPGTEAHVLTDSPILHRYFNGDRSLQDEELFNIADAALQLMRKKKLTIHVGKLRRRCSPEWKPLGAF
jgi:hypothetical protein